MVEFGAPPDIIPSQGAQGLRVKSSAAVWLLNYIGARAGWRVIRYVLSRARDEDDVGLVYRRAELLCRMLLPVFRSGRHVTLANLKLVFPEWSRAKRLSVLHRAARNLCRGFIDIYRYIVRQDQARRRIRVVGAENLDRAIAHGRGFFLTTGHVGVFPYVGVPVMWRGFPFGTAARNLEDQRMWDLFKAWRDAIGMVYVPADDPLAFLKRVMEILKGGGGVSYTIDIRPDDEHVSVEAEFLGRKTRMFSALVRIAARTRALLLPCYTVREPDGFHHRVVYYPPFEVPPQAAEADNPAIVEVVQHLSDWLSDVIRTYPCQWWWVRRRWEQADY